MTKNIQPMQLQNLISDVLSRARIDHTTESGTVTESFPGVVVSVNGEKVGVAKNINHTVTVGDIQSGSDTAGSSTRRKFAKHLLKEKDIFDRAVKQNSGRQFVGSEGEKPAPELTHSDRRILRKNVTKPLQDGKQAFDLVEKLEDKFGFNYIGKGAFRRVLAFTEQTKKHFDMPCQTDCVLKLARDNGWGNELEVKSYNTIPEEHRDEWLVPIIDHCSDFKWVIMERATTDADSISFDDKRELEQKIKREGWDYSDVKTSNMGIHDGKKKLVDYGYYWSNSKTGKTIEV